MYSYCNLFKATILVLFVVVVLYSNKTKVLEEADFI